MKQEKAEEIVSLVMELFNVQFSAVKCKMWEEELLHHSYDLCLSNVKRHMKESTFQPTMADILKGSRTSNDPRHEKADNRLIDLGECIKEIESQGLKLDKSQLMADKNILYKGIPVLTEGKTKEQYFQEVNLFMHQVLLNKKGE